MQMAQNGSVVPIHQIPASQVPSYVQQQQGGKGGFGGAPKGGGAFPAGGWGNQGFGFPNQGGGGGYAQKPKDDNDMDDWLAKRMGGKSDSSSTAAGQNESDSQKSKPKQQAQGVPPQQHQQMPQQPGQGQPQMQQQHIMQMQQQQYQQQWQWQQQQQQQWQWQQQQQQQQPHLPSLQTQGAQSTSLSGKGWADSPRTAAWRQKLAEAGPTAQMSVDEWASKREKALADAPRQRPRPVATSAPKPREEDEEDSSQPIIPMEQLAHVFADARPWAEITDEDKANEMWALERADILASKSVSEAQAKEPSAASPAAEKAVASSPASPAAKKAPAAESEPAPAAAAAPAVVASEPAPAAASADKRKKALQKKLRQIVDLEERQRKGEKIDDEMKAKIASKAAIEAEIAEL